MKAVFARVGQESGFPHGLHAGEDVGWVLEAADDVVRGQQGEEQVIRHVEEMLAVGRVQERAGGDSADRDQEGLALPDRDLDTLVPGLDTTHAVDPAYVQQDGI